MTAVINISAMILEQHHFLRRNSKARGMSGFITSRALTFISTLDSKKTEYFWKVWKTNTVKVVLE